MGERDGEGQLGSGGSRVEAGGSKPGVILEDLLKSGTGGGVDFFLGSMAKAS